MAAWLMNGLEIHFTADSQLIGGQRRQRGHSFDSTIGEAGIAR
jgi:hypothetical protein